MLREEARDIARRAAKASPMFGEQVGLIWKIMLVVRTRLNDIVRLLKFDSNSSQVF